MPGPISTRLGLTLLSMLVAAQGVQAGGIPSKTIKDLKAASVYIKLDLRDAVGPLPITGSGFLVHADGATGYIMTNSHVVTVQPGQTSKGGPRVVFHSSTPAEQTVEGVVVANDPVRDLAVLKVTDVKELPRPIPIDPNLEATETMTVYSLGFPFGGALAFTKGNPAITITRGTVSSLRNDAAGQITLVQIDAEINPGNSGGPVVDDKGNLLGVAVSKIINTRTVGFAIPVKAVSEMMQGKVARAVLEVVALEETKAKVKVDASLLDPISRLKNAALHYGPARDYPMLPKPDKHGKSPLLKDAKPVDIKIESGKGLGYFLVDRPQENCILIAAQIVYTNGLDEKVISQAVRTTVYMPKAVYMDTLTRADAIDESRRFPAKRFTHKVEAGKHYVIQMRAEPKDVDPWLIVRDSAGKILAEDDDSGGYPNALVVYSPTKNDEIQISATAFSGDNIGPFLLSIREETGITLGRMGFNKADKLSADEPFDTITNAPAQSFQFVMKKGKNYIFEMKSKEIDPYLRLENMAGINLKNEDVGGESQSILYFTPLQDGIYRVVATSYDLKAGAFEFKAAEGEPNKQNTVGEQGLKLTASLTKTDPLDIEFGKPTAFRCKLYEVKLNAGTKYEFSLTTSQFDPVLRLEDSRGAELGFDRNSGGRLNPRLVFTPQADGVYRAIVSHFDARLGDFTLAVRTLPP